MENFRVLFYAIFLLSSTYHLPKCIIVCFFENSNCVLVLNLNLNSNCGFNKRHFY